MLNKLHFDFRNAKPAFLGVSFCKLDNVGTQSVVQQTELGSGKNTKQVECGEADTVECNVNDNGADDNTGQLVAGSAVQVDNDDSGVATARHHSSNVVIKDEPPGTSCTSAAVTTEYTECAEQLLPSCSATVGDSPQPPAASVHLSVDSFQRQLKTSKRTDFPRHKKNGRKSEQTDRTVTENQTAARVTDDDVVLKPVSVLVNELCSCKDCMAVSLQSTSLSTTELSGRGGYSSTSPIVLYDDDDLDAVALSEKVHVIPSASGVKKLLKSENVPSLHYVTDTGIKLEPKCKDGKLKVVRTTKRRRRKKHDSDGEFNWSMRKKLLIMPGDKKFSKSRCRRKQKVRRSSFSQTAKSKGHKSVSVEEMELPDLSATLDNGADYTDMSNLLKAYDEVPVEDSTVSGKWYVDVTGADLDIDFQRATKSSRHRKYVVSNKAAEQKVAEFLPQNAPVEVHHTNLSNSQETPPPSVASDGCLERDEPDQSAYSDAEDVELQESADAKWLTIYTKLARYIDGRRFDRLVNGVSVQVSAAVMDETVAQVGLECLRLAKLTKRDVKELKDQVRLEEIYHRRAKKAMLSVQDSSDTNVKRRSSARRNVSGFDQRSAAKHAAKFQRTGHNGMETESETAEADAENQQGISFSSSDELHPLAAEKHLSSGDRGVTKSGGLLNGDISKGADKFNYEATDNDHINVVDGVKRRQSAKVGRDIHSSRHASAVSQSQVPGQVCESTPASVSFHEQTSTMDSCVESEWVAAFGCPDECFDASLQQELVSGNTLLPKDYSSGSTYPAVDVYRTQRAAAYGIAMTTDAGGTDNNEYIAAVALASLSMLTESQPHSSCQLLSSKSKACTDAALQINQQHKSTQRTTDVAVTSDIAEEFLPQDLSVQSKVSETVIAASSVKPSKYTAASNRHWLKAGGRTSDHISVADKQSERSARGVGDSVSDHTRGTSSKQRSRDRMSRSAGTAHHQKPVEQDREKLSTTCSSKSTVNFDSGSSHVAISSVDKKNTESAATLSDILPKSSKSVASDKTKRRRESSRSGDKSAVGHRRQKKVAGGSSLSCASVSSVQPLVEPSHHITDVNVGGSDLSPRKESALPLDYTAMTVSAVGSTSMLCSSPPATCAPHDLIYSTGKHYDKGTKISLKLQLMDPAVLSLTTENTQVEQEDDQHSETGRKTTFTGYRVFSDLNSNSVLNSPEMLSHFDDTSAVQVASGNADTNITMSSTAAGETVSHSCSVAGNSDKTVYTEAGNLLQSSEVLVNFTPYLQYREPEDIWSPSPVHLGFAENRSGEIRSPSPCSMESPEEVFSVVETSWDVKLSSPCEIQSPDCSGDEANDSIEQFDRHCNVCSQHGPVTIPLNMEEIEPQNG